jgi:ligand-binding sensor domain-containing protein
VFSRGRPAALVVGFFLLQALSAVTARTHLAYEFDRSRGLDTTGVVNLIQDRNGFLWVGGFLSIFRYDGREFRRWNKDPLAGNPEGFADDLLEGVIVKLAFPSEKLFRVTDTGLESYEPSLTPPLGVIRDLAASSDGSLWICDSVGLRHRGVDREWKTYPFSSFGDIQPHRLLAIPGGGVLALTQQHLFRVTPGQEPFHLTTVDGFIAAAEQTVEGRIFLVYGGIPGGTLAEVVEGKLQTLTSHFGRPTDLVVRNDSIWVAFDNGLIRWHPNDGTETILIDGGFYTGGARFQLDHENSLWIGGFTNLVLLPEPDTSVWTVDDGMAEFSISWVVEGADGIWTSAYAGVDLIRHPSIDLGAQAKLRGFSHFKICTDEAGRLWHAHKNHYTHPAGIYESLAGNESVHQFRDNSKNGTCAPSGDGRVWLNRDLRLYKTAPDGGRPPLLAELPDHGRVWALHESKEGELWVAYIEKTCHAPVRTLGDEATPWRCTDEDRITWSRSFVETDQGDLWIDSSQGLLRWTGESWQMMTGLPTGQIYHLVPSPRGGIWIAAKQYIVRVLPDPDDPSRVSIVERLTMWQGLPNETGSSIV